jgi:hypothetical protein
VGQRLEGGAKSVLHAARAIRDAANLSMVAAEESDNAVRFAQGIRFQNNRITLMENHEVAIIPWLCGACSIRVVRCIAEAFAASP